MPADDHRPVDAVGATAAKVKGERGCYAAATDTAEVIVLADSNTGSSAQHRHFILGVRLHRAFSAAQRASTLAETGVTLQVW